MPPRRTYELPDDVKALLRELDMSVDDDFFMFYIYGEDKFISITSYRRYFNGESRLVVAIQNDEHDQYNQEEYCELPGAVEMIKEYMRKLDYPVDAILRRKRLQALIGDE